MGSTGCQEGKEQAERFCSMEKLQKLTGLDLKHSVLETIQVTGSAGKEMISVTWDNASAVLAVDQDVSVKMDTRQSFYYADSFLAKLLFCFVVWTFSRCNGNLLCDGAASLSDPFGNLSKETFQYLYDPWCQYFGTCGYGEHARTF